MPANLALKTEPLPTNTWLVSYPRSGNTFLRALLANYFSGLPRPVTLEELHLSTIGEHIEHFWADIVGKPPVSRTLEEEFAGRREYFSRLKDVNRDILRIFKSHTPFSKVNDAPAFEFGADDRIVHLVRHPCDVVISYAHYYEVPLEDAITRLNTDNLTHIGHPGHGFELIGSWAQHTASWAECDAAPIIHVRYSALVQDTEAELARIVEFMGGPVNPERVRMAAEFSRLGRLRNQEQATGFIENTARAAPFFRQGIPGKWTDTLTVDQARRIINANAAQMDRFGFMKLFLS